MTQLHLDVAPLQEPEYTGIPQVAAKLAEQMLGDGKIEPHFFYNRQAVPRPIVEHLLRERGGALFRWASERYRFSPIPAPSQAGEVVMGLHTNMKFARRLFPVEGQIVHDLTTVLAPQYHTAETVRYHVEKFYGDLHTNDVTFCVSQSTAFDVASFYPNLPGKIVVSHLGVDWHHINREEHDDGRPVENYVLVLGTLEPRKNVLDILDMLARWPQLLKMYRFVFGGRVGWGNSFEEQVVDRGLVDALDQGRIVRTGFVSETAKFLLFRHASAVIYPSVYEGFGLPVAEAISLGLPVVTTASSSLPEVGRNFAHYFTPGDRDSLRAALTAALKEGGEQGWKADEVADWRRYFAWDRCYATIKRGLFEAAGINGNRT